MKNYEKKEHGQRGINISPTNQGKFHYSVMVNCSRKGYSSLRSILNKAMSTFQESAYLLESYSTKQI